MPRFVGALDSLVSSFPQATSSSFLQGVPPMDYVVPVLTGVFITSTSILVMYVAIRAFLAEHLLSVLFLGLGALTFGITSLIAVTSSRTLGVDLTAAIFAAGALLSAFFHFACSSLTYLGDAPSLRRGHVVGWVTLAMFCSGLLVVAYLNGFLLPFYLPGTGTTSVGQFALSVATATFALSAAMMLSVFGSRGSAILYWYSLALGARAVGLLGMILSGGAAGPVAMWIGWGVLYLGSLFLVKSILSAERGTSLPLPTSGR